MTALYPSQDAFVRGEISPRLHARASLDLYRAALSKCENFITLPHGGARKRGGTYFVNTVKDSSKKTRLIPFIFSSEQAYCLEVGHLYLRVYAYGARVGTVEVTTPWTEAQLDQLQFDQSSDVMWIVHKDHRPRTLTRTDNTTWTLAEFIFENGPYDELNTQGTTLTPADTTHLTPKMTSNSAPSGTASGHANAWQMFDRNKSQSVTINSGAAGDITYSLPGTTKRVVDAYWITGPTGDEDGDYFTAWEVQGSNDGTNYVTLDTRSGETGWNSGETRFYDFINEVAYGWYRLAFSGGGGGDGSVTEMGEIAYHVKASDQTPFDLTASATTGINGGAGFVADDVGRAILLRGADGRDRWARVISVTSSTVVKIRLYGHALPTASPISYWRLGTFVPGKYVESVALFEERLAFSRRFSVFGSATGDFDDFTLGEEDDDALEFVQAGGGQANDIVWLAESDGALLIGTSGGVRALSGSGIDEALTPSSFKNRKSRTAGCAKMRPIDAGSSFLYVTRSRKSIAELTANGAGRLQSEDLAQISEHIPKKGIVDIAFQSDPDPILWFPLETGELGGYTHQPAQEVRGMHRHLVGGSFGAVANGIIERVAITPGQDGIDDVWLIVKRTIGGQTKRTIEILTAAFEYAALSDAFYVDCGLSRTGSPVNSVTGLSHLNGQVVSALADGKVYKSLTVSSGSVSLPGGATASTWHVGLPWSAEMASLELDVGARDGSLVGRRKKVGKVILSLLETDTTGLEVSSYLKGKWEKAKLPTIVPPDGKANLFTGNMEVLVEDSWEGQARVRIRHTNPTPCTIRAMTPVFDSEGS